MKAPKGRGRHVNLFFIGVGWLTALASHATTKVLPTDRTAGKGALMPYCETCGSHVSTDFVRVFGGRTGRVHACQSCEDLNLPYRKAAGLTADHA